jgi:hypothetical protein
MGDHYQHLGFDWPASRPAPTIHNWDSEAVPVLTWATWGWLRRESVQPPVKPTAGREGR